MIKPKRLKAGDTVAVISPSWGGPGTYPSVYEMGVATLRERFGLIVKELSHTRASGDFLHANPQARAADVNAAFADTEVKAVIASIGGEDSIRILPYLDDDVIRANPKILMGFSDTTTLTTYINRLGLVTFNGPSVMTEFTIMRHLEAAFEQHVRDILFTPSDRYEYKPFEEWVYAFQPWKTPGYDGTPEKRANTLGWRWVQGEGRATGRLFGGCIEVLEFMNGTRFWPEPDFWNDRILFLETSEDKPTPNQVRYIVRNYGMQGIFDRISAIVFARPFRYDDDEREKLWREVVGVVAGEFGRPTLPILGNVEFGHDSPKLILPLGCLAEIDCNAKRFALIESPVDLT